MDSLKQQSAKAALDFIDDDMIVGVGTGSTVNLFIEQLAVIKHRIDACVASSLGTQQRLRALGIPVVDLNVAGEVAIYIDGADEVTAAHQMIKGGGGALTREKILAAASRQFICIVDESKLVNRLGAFPVAVEVIPMARSMVARELVKLGGDPEYREGFVTDNGNIILDVYNFEIEDAMALEQAIKLLPGVVENGLFARQLADKVIVAGKQGIRVV
ncbi:ribose 5-phosphate isomerase, constitutive [Legionella quinlivanii]|uniref:Ribose-5-phosphate isomerase A n=1 Tax=Legionella quinlivanii TaxID=45073 RepID=A0A0W0Y6B8_9GAMM|nr:ribose-5-phosphate isomerase RpiA [Legionella quinlivanii]KTD52230.1 ribose 5-phosphate isomerase, constitutive [Legionella quinlivanii]SEF75035.1 ribose-5-phosphate isomerase [Legionella quinlivanii DSM 21216]STY12271.1 ribose 5-phosphate isomerase, constitutive [Legionella quinlivanii]